jgi:hypothetical protein
VAEDRDLVVARAIAQLPVPDHLPGFWEVLEGRLAAEHRPGTTRVRVDTAELPAVSVLRPPAPAPAAHRARFLAAAAVLAVVALTAGLVLRGDDGSTPTGEAAGEPVAPLSTPPGPPFPTTMVSLPRILAAPASPTAAAEAWIAAVGSGDVSTATAMLGGRTLRYLDAGGEDPTVAIRALAESYGRWPGSRPPIAAELHIPGAGTVVVLDGDPALALPVAPAGPDQWFVEPLAFDPETGGRIELLSPEPGGRGLAAVGPDAVLQAVSEDPGAAIWFSLDGAPPEPAPDGTWDPPGRIDEGRHLLVVAAVGDDTFTAVATTLAVTG